MEQRYKDIFAEIFEVDEGQLGPDFNSDNVEKWDSVIQLSLVNAMEDEFDIMLDTEDILEFKSYEGGKAILAKYDVEVN